LLKEDMSTLYLIVPVGGLVQELHSKGAFARCIQFHSLRVSFARVTIVMGEVSVSSHSLVL